MQRPGGPDDPYGGYKEDTPHSKIPSKLDGVTLDGKPIEYGEGQSYFSEDHGGPYELTEVENGVARIKDLSA